MSLMRGPQVEEPVVEVKEEEKVGPIRALAALPAATGPPSGAAPEDPGAQNQQMQAFGLDITKEDNGQYVILFVYISLVQKH